MRRGDRRRGRPVSASTTRLAPSPATMNTAVCENQTAAPPKRAARRSRPDDSSASDSPSQNAMSVSATAAATSVEYGLNSEL